MLPGAPSTRGRGALRHRGVGLLELRLAEPVQRGAAHEDLRRDRPRHVLEQVLGVDEPQAFDAVLIGVGMASSAGAAAWSIRITSMPFTPGI